MRYDVTFTNGVVKAREKYLLGEKIERMADGTAEDALRILKESGFGGEIAVESVAQAEKLVRAEEKALNDFIREYAPDEDTAAFLLAEYDFHNAEALVRCRYAGAAEEKLLANEGLLSADALRAAVRSEEYAGLPKEMAEAIALSAASFAEGRANGLDVDCAFKRGLFAYKKRRAKSGVLKSVLSSAADAANVSSALRSRNASLAEKMFVPGGKLPLSQMIALSELPFEQIESGEYSARIKSAAAAAKAGRPFTEFEKFADEYPLDLLDRTRYDMKGAEPFLAYVFRRRAEMADVRLIAVSFAAGLSGGAVKNKIRKY